MQDHIATEADTHAKRSMVQFGHAAAGAGGGVIDAAVMAGLLLNDCGRSLEAALTAV
jgi:hypothetical protein